MAVALVGGVVYVALLPHDPPMRPMSPEMTAVVREFTAACVADRAGFRPPWLPHDRCEQFHELTARCSMLVSSEDIVACKAQVSARLRRGEGGG